MMMAYSLYDDFEYDVAALVYTIYPIDAGAAFVTPTTPAFSPHHDTFAEFLAEPVVLHLTSGRRFELVYLQALRACFCTLDNLCFLPPL